MTRHPDTILDASRLARNLFGDEVGWPGVRCECKLANEIVGVAERHQ
jgi:hypothetical protein